MDHLQEIRRLYFETAPATIDRDFARAIELLKELPDEVTRGRAHVYMEGLAEMRKEWVRRAGRSRGSAQKDRRR